MECVYCGKETGFFTTEDEPICHHCAEAHGFFLCTDLGKYIPSCEFVCSQSCSDCMVKEREDQYGQQQV